MTTNIIAANTPMISISLDVIALPTPSIRSDEDESVYEVFSQFNNDSI